MPFTKGNKLWDNPKTKATQFKRGVSVSVDTQFQKGCEPWNKGKKDYLVGEKNPAWKGGVVSHPDYFSSKCNERRLRKIGNGGSHSLEEWVVLKKKYGFMCLCCKKVEPEIQLTRDHIVPVGKGGTDDIDNIQPLCRSCNSRKWATEINFIKILPITLMLKEETS